MTRSSPSVPRVERFGIPPPAPETVGLAARAQDVAISPDCRYVIYSATGGNPFQLYVRAVDSLSAIPLQGLDTQVFHPFVSPDSAWVGFLDNTLGNTGDVLKKVSILGGPAVIICRLDSNWTLT